MSQHPLQEVLAAYALDVADEQQRAEVAAHLEQCARCRDEATELREAANLLAHLAAPVAPPARLRERVLTDARTVTPLAARRQPRGPRTRPGASSGVVRWAGWLAAAASIVFALVLGNALRQERTERLALEQRWETLQREAAGRDSLLAVLLGRNVQTATLAATGEPPSMRLFWNARRGVVVLSAYDLPPAPPGRTYQLWGIPAGGAPISLGEFNTGPQGRGLATLAVPAGLHLELSAVTEEPAGGSPQPTTTPFLVGNWQDVS